MSKLLTAILMFWCVAANAASFPYIKLNGKTNIFSDNGTALTYNGKPIGGGGSGTSPWTNSPAGTASLVSGITNAVAGTWIANGYFNTPFNSDGPATAWIHSPDNSGYSLVITLDSITNNFAYEGMDTTGTLYLGSQNGVGGNFTQLNSSYTAGVTITGNGNTALTTGDPGSGTAAWKLGKKITGVSVAIVATNYVEVNIGGSVVKLAIVQ